MALGQSTILIVFEIVVGVVDLMNVEPHYLVVISNNHLLGVFSIFLTDSVSTCSSLHITKKNAQKLKSEGGLWQWASSYGKM